MAVTSDRPTSATAVAAIGIAAPFALGAFLVGPLLLPGMTQNAYLFLGATLAVAWEQRQVREAPRIQVSLPSMVRLGSGATLRCQTRDLSLSGAGLTMSRQEPLPAGHPFWSTEGIIVLPHIGGPHPQRDRIVARLFVDNLGRCHSLAHTF